MKRLILLASILAITGCGAKPPHKDVTRDHKTHDAHAGHDMTAAPSMLMVDTKPTKVVPGEPTQLKLMIHAADGKMVKDFDEIHEKRLHLIIVREGLDQFAHVHPEIDAAGNISTTFTFPVPGRYRLYADHKPSGQEPSTAQGTVDVAGAAPTAPQLVPNVPGSVSGDGLDAVIDVENAAAGKEATITFHVRDQSGQSVNDLQTYLGAMGHLVVLSSDGSRYVHAHPADGASGQKDTVSFAAHFMEPGIYKSWGQFQRADQVHTIPFVVKVE